MANISNVLGKHFECLRKHTRHGDVFCVYSVPEKTSFSNNKQICFFSWNYVMATSYICLYWCFIKKSFSAHVFGGQIMSLWCSKKCLFQNMLLAVISCCCDFLHVLYRNEEKCLFCRQISVVLVIRKGKMMTHILTMLEPKKCLS